MTVGAKVEICKGWVGAGWLMKTLSGRLVNAQRVKLTKVQRSIGDINIGMPELSLSHLILLIK